MGFDNECILNIQSLAGEYFCPVCRLLVYPSEALQSQCTHLYCKQCLSYVVGTTKACPYDGYLVTEADSKPLIESNKALAEIIEKIAVHCLYHRSGCTWQGSLSDCTAHCAGCAFGNSPVVCNRCGTQIVHRQVQEHAQSCPGVQPQPQQPDSGQVAPAASSMAAAAQQNQTAPPAGTPASHAQSTQIAAAVAPASGHDQSKVTTSTQPQAAATSAPTPEQWYQQQQQHYQQYYQNYPGYDPYQQQYQQYVPYRQAHPANVQGQQQPPLQPQVRPQTQSQQPQLQSQSQPQVHLQQQHPQIQQMSTRPPIQGQPHSQLYPQVRPQPQAHQVQLQAQPYMQQRPHVPHSQLQLPQSQPLSHPIPQSQPHMHSQPQQSHLQPQVPLQPPPHSLPQQHSHHPHVPAHHPPAQAVTGQQSYPQPQPYQNVPPGAIPQVPHHIHPQQGITQQPTVMRPPQGIAQHPQASAMLLPPQGQRPNLLPAQQQPVRPPIHHSGHVIQPHPGMTTLQQQPAPQQKQQLQAHLPHPQAFPGQTPGLVQNQSHHPGPFLQHQAVQPQMLAQGPPASLQQNIPTAFGQPLQSQNHEGRPVVPNSGVSHQKFQQSTGGTAQAKPVQPASSQNYPLRANTQVQSPSVQVSKKVEPILETGSQNSDAKELAPNRELEVVPSRQLAGGTKDPSVPNGSQDDRVNSLPAETYTKVPEDGYNQLSEERFKPFPGEPNKHIADRREFDEDLKQFPRAGHLDAERFPGYESYPSSRPLDRGPYGNHDVGPKSDGPSGAASRLPSYHSGNSSARSLMPVGFPNENMGRKGNPAVGHPDFLRPFECGRHMPPPRSPGREFPRFVSDGIDGRESHVFGEQYKSYLPSNGSEFQESRYPHLPSHLRRGVHDGADILPIHLRGVEPGGPHHFSNHMHLGESAGFDPFPNHLRMGGSRNFGPGNLAPDMLGEVGHGRIGDPGYNGGFPFSEHQIDSGYYHADEESFDHSRKRKQGSMGWCRICKVDCETVEGLEAHSQTRDHQKMAMDIVLNIKKSSAKKHKLSSDDNISHEDTNKSRKGNFDNRGNMH